MEGVAGRRKPRWSLVGEPAGSPWAMAGLPGSSAWVKVGPPLFCSGPSRGSRGAAAVPTWSWFWPLTKL